MEAGTRYCSAPGADMDRRSVSDICFVVTDGRFPETADMQRWERLLEGWQHSMANGGVKTNGKIIFVLLPGEVRSHPQSTAMFKNLVIVSFRALLKDKGYTLLNILGLTAGIAFSLLLFFYIMDELSYDRFNEQAAHIYRISSSVKEPTNITQWAYTQFPLAQALQRDYPEVEQATRIARNDGAMYKSGTQLFFEPKILFADSNLFEVFTVKFLEGDPKLALVAPNSLVLTESLAEKYFGKGRNPLGQSLRNNSGTVYKITGVIKDLPKNSHILYSGLISMSTIPRENTTDWSRLAVYTYVLLRPHVDAQAFEKKLLPMYDKYMASIFTQFNIKINYGVQPVTAIHLHSDLGGEPEDLGSISYIYIFSIAAAFLILIACINYMNLTTARSSKRAKEIAVRKVAGSSRSRLIMQFLTESVLVTLVSFFLSLLCVYLLLPIFNGLSGKLLSLQTLFQSDTFLLLLAIVLFVGLAGGSYPAFYLSKFKPIAVLKGNLSRGSRNSTLRKILVVLQFSISMIMLICTLVVFDQLQFIRSKDLGFNRQGVLYIRVYTGGDDLHGRLSDFKNELRKDPAVQSVSLSDNVPGNPTSYRLFTVESGNGFIDKPLDTYGIDGDFIKTLGMRVVKGRNFSSSPSADTANSVIVNESMVQHFNWVDAIGKKIKLPGDTSGKYFEVVGVVKDFNQKSLYNPVTPLLLFNRPGQGNVEAKISLQNIPATISSIKKSWKNMFPGFPFQYTFLDQDFASQYAADQKRGKIFFAFSALTIAISCLGLLGLVSYTSEQRKKEISLRKVLGAGTRQIVALISTNYMVLVGISTLIAFPIAYYFMYNWLGLFYYKTSLSAPIFLVSAFAVFLITLLTVSFHIVKAAIAKPIDNLRME